MELEPETAYTLLVPVEVVGDLMANGALNLGAQQLGVLTEVAFQCVLVDDDVISVVVPGDGVADVVAVGSVLVAQVGDQNRDILEYLLEFRWQIVNSRDNLLVELAKGLLSRR